MLGIVKKKKFSFTEENNLSRVRIYKDDVTEKELHFITKIMTEKGYEFYLDKMKDFFCFRKSISDKLPKLTKQKLKIIQQNGEWLKKLRESDRISTDISDDDDLNLKTKQMVLVVNCGKYLKQLNSLIKLRI